MTTLAKHRSNDSGSEFKGIEPVSIRSQVIAALKEAFFSGRLKPGDVIIERKLSRQLNVGTPTIREALVSLHEQGFVRRVANTATYVTKFTPEEVRKLELLRVEMEVLAFRWAKQRVVDDDLCELERMVDLLVQAGEAGDARQFLERDLQFHTRCWMLSGNEFLVETLQRVMMPLSAFVVLASGAALTADIAREHYKLVDALRNLEEPEFSATVQETIGGFAARWIQAMSERE